MKKKTSCETTVYSRVTGFYAPVNGYNPGKKGEFLDRKHYNVGGKDEGRAGEEVRDNVPRP